MEKVDGLDKKNTPIGLNPKVWLRLGKYLKVMKKDLIPLGFIAIIYNVIIAAFPLFTGYAIDNFITPGVTAGIVPFSLLYLVAIIVASVGTVLWCKLLMRIDMNVGMLIRRDCFIHLQKLPLSYHNTTSVGYLIGRVMSDTERICSMISWGFAHIVESLLVIIFSITFMLILSPVLALILIIAIPVAYIIAWLFQRKIIVIGRKVREINSLITGAYNEGITGSKTSKTLVIEDANSADFSKLSDRMYRESVRSSRLMAMMIPIIMSLGSFALAVVLYRGGLLVEVNLLHFGVLAAFITYAWLTIEPIIWVTSVLGELVSAQVGVERVTGLLDEEVTIFDRAEVVEKYGDSFHPKRENWEKIHGRVTFENVWFQYPDGDENVLEDFSLDVPSGSMVAIVGETGAGKSTIVNLVCRFYEPTSGRVLIDGIDSRDRSQLWLHSSLGYVLQDPHLFSGTIMENIRYGRLDATDEEVIAAAKLVSADVVAERMPDGYATDVGEGGDKLSTGEKQLISLARAILADPPIFILDEATSSIDTETEQLVQNAISHILEGRTSFVIAHRLSTIVRSDIILVVDDGKIVERGTHGELLDAGGQYSKLYKAMRLEETDI